MVDDARQRLVDIPDIEGFEIIHLLTVAKTRRTSREPQITLRFDDARAAIRDRAVDAGVRRLTVK